MTGAGAFRDEQGPRLIAVSGRFQGTVFPLDVDEVVIGRDPASSIALHEPWISRTHCTIRREGEIFRIRDEKSHNGTFLNGRPIEEAVLEHEDRIALGGTTLEFLLRIRDDPGERAVELGEDRPTLAATLELRSEDAAYLSPERLEGRRLGARRAERDLCALLAATQTLLVRAATESLEKGLLRLLFDRVPAERGAILLGDPEALQTFASVRDEAGAPAPVRVSRTVVRQVLQSGSALLSNRVERDASLARAESLQQGRVAALVCVPMLLRGEAMGAIYLDSTVPGVRFEDDQLEMLMAVASVAGAAFDNRRWTRALVQDNERLRLELEQEHQMIGQSAAMRSVFELLARVAPADTTVLITGESGTGKELVARALHARSSRARGSFVKVDCTTLTENLLASELFGHEKGAFTGAIAQKKGKIELADGGTVFLDEVGELPKKLQSQLLRVLQDREIERVGGTRPIPVDVRLVAATNRNLEQEVRAQSFREDLYYRLNVVKLTMPALRERRDDVILLAEHFLSRFAGKAKRRVAGFSEETLELLRRHSWPGNVRELENAIERAVVLGTTELVLAEDLPEALFETASMPWGAERTVPRSFHEGVTGKKKELVLDAMARAKGSFTEAARLLGLHPNYLHRLVTNLGLRDEIARLK